MIVTVIGGGSGSGGWRGGGNCSGFGWYSWFWCLA